MQERENAIQERNKNREMINKRTRQFKSSTHRESSNFDRVKAEMTILYNKDVASKIQNVLHRADFALKRERERERKRRRERERKRAREREQESTIAVEREEILRSAVAVDEEERERERRRERSRDRERERRDREQAASLKQIMLKAKMFSIVSVSSN